MIEHPEKPAQISQEDWNSVDVPVLTDEEFSRAVPFPKLFPDQALALKIAGGQPRLANPKIKVTLRLSADVVEHVKRMGKGSAARIEQVLKEAIAKGTL